MKEEINEFLDYLAEEKHYSKHTLAAYNNDLKQLANFVETKKPGVMLDSPRFKLEETILLEYLHDLKEKKYRPATVARKVAAVKSFFRFMKKQGKMAEELTRNLVPPQVKRKKPFVLSVSEVRQLLAEPAKLATPEAKRDKIMLELLYATGLRVSELVSLDLADINLAKKQLLCSSRSSRGRVIPLDSVVADGVKEYIEEARVALLQNEKETGLFLNCRGECLTRQGFWQIVKDYAHKAGLGVNVTPHTLRHTFATHKLKSGTSLHSLQELLGHAYISSTRIYDGLSKGEQ